MRDEAALDAAIERLRADDPQCEAYRAAIEYAEAGWAVFQLSDTAKVPRAACEVCKPWKGSARVFVCKGPSDAVHCGGTQCHGSSDATTKPWLIKEWWTKNPSAGLAIRVPDGIIVLDADPRHEQPGDIYLELLQGVYGPLPETLRSKTGGEGESTHTYLRIPMGMKLTLSAFSNVGLDIKTAGGYCVEWPTVHEKTGKPYVWTHLAPVADCPGWLLKKIARPEPVMKERKPVDPRAWLDENPYARRGTIEERKAALSFTSLLDGAGWTLVGGDGDSDGSTWRHPTATSKTSATISDGRLFVYSPNTPFDVTTTGDPRGYDVLDVAEVLK